MSRQQSHRACDHHGIFQGLTPSEERFGIGSNHRLMQSEFRVNSVKRCLLCEAGNGQFDSHPDNGRAGFKRLY